MIKQHEHILGTYTGMAGSERALYHHRRDPDVLIGVEHRTQADIFLRLYYLTGNIFYYLFPKNFVKIVAVGNTEGEQTQSISVVRKIDAERLGYGETYAQKKKELVGKISPLFLEEIREHLSSIIDFNGSSPNLLIDKEGNPMYVDKLPPILLEYLDLSAVAKHVNDPRIYNLIEKLITKTIEMYHDWKKRQDFIDKLYEV